MIRTLLSLAMVGVCGFALAQGRFQRESEDFPAGNQATRRIIDVGGCKETGEVSKLSLMKVGPLGRSLAALIVTRVQVKFENQAQPETVLEGDSAFYYDFFRLNKPCVDQIIIDGKSTHSLREFRIRAELE